MKRFLSWHIITIIIVGLILAFFDAPGSLQKKIFPWTPDSISKEKIHLGLDLQGGSQLDYKIDLRDVPESEKENITNGVREVIEKRVNKLGVSEPNIYLSTVGNEQHIIVEIAEVKDLDEAKRQVGKTIQLEFKEEKTEKDPEEVKKYKADAQNILSKILEKPENFNIMAQEEAQANAERVQYEAAPEQGQFINKLSEGMKEAVKKLNKGQIHGQVIEVQNEYSLNAEGQLEQKDGVYIIKLEDKTSEVRFDKELDASHILIAYKDAKNAQETVKRTESEAKKLAQELSAKAKEGSDFAKLAQDNSDDVGTKADGGVLKDPVNKDASYVTEFKNGALAIEKAGDISGPVKSELGFHIIKANAIRKDIRDDKVKIEKLFISTAPNPWKDTNLTGEHFVNAEVKFDEFFKPYIAIRFNEEGAKLFEDITARNVGKKVAIFVGGTMISDPTVQAKIPGGQAVITNPGFTPESAQTLARDMNTGAIPAPIVLAGQHTIGSTLGQEALTKSINAGIIGLILVAIFMITLYRLPGLLAVLALSIYTILLLFIIKSELPMPIAMLIAAVIFVILIYKIINSEENKGEKFLSFILSIAVLFFVGSLLSSPITLTLAGVAGVILSIGMAVDANILIFERMKEELQNGHSMAASIERGFERAWSSIRDSNFSSLITCAILFYFGSSLIRGFAINLAAGIIISMFTAITISRTLLRSLVGTKISEKLGLFFSQKKKEKKTLRIIEHTKTWLGFSGVLALIALLATMIFGVKFGMDFTGGTFMELKFKNSDVTVQQIKTALGQIEDEMTEPSTQTVSVTTGSAIKTSPAEGQTAQLKDAQVINADEGSFQIKTKFMSNEIHDEVLQKLKEKLGDVNEIRFENIGPTIGSTMKGRALIALIVASLMIMAYLAFAFRKIPKHVNPWRFGACAIIALLHDLFITFGFFIILGKFGGVEIDALFITALLTVLGFSVHDTIVVFDRIRENLKNSDSESIADIANKSMTETMSRSINTSLSTLITLTALLIFGSPSIFYFTLALAFGIAIGTYSSIFVATPLLVKWTEWRMRQEK